MLPPDVASFVNAQRTARLATVAPDGKPHVVPICFAYADGIVYSVLDAKPKRVPVRSLRRVRNLLANPNVQLLFDRWDEDWTRLAYVQVSGTAGLREAGPEQRHAIDLLRVRYPQYEAMDLDESPVIEIVVEGYVSWGDFMP